MDRTILFVCTGNTCRSPMAEGLARKLISDGHLRSSASWRLESAGTWAANGDPASAGAIVALAGMDIDLTGHVSQPLTRQLVDAATIIFAMTGGHCEAARELCLENPKKILLLDPAGADIADPIGQHQDVYVQIAARIHDCLLGRFKEIA